MTAPTQVDRLAPADVGRPAAAEAPRVTVIMAVRNEERLIRWALAAACAQDYPAERLEIVVADGESTDRTREIVLEIARHDPRVRLLDNPQRHVAAGLNRAARAARGEILVRLDGHCRAPLDYVSTCVRMLQQGIGDSVGGPVRAIGETWMGEGIARAMSSPFGVGGASFRYTRRAGPVDHLPFCALWRATFDRLGGYDEELVRNQDDELSFRLIQAGGRIVLDPTIVVDYWSRSSLAGLWRQYFGYGFYKVKVNARRGGRPASWRQLVPPLFVAALAAGAIRGVAGDWRPLGALLALYALFLAAAAGWMALRGARWAAAAVPLAIATLHLAYGAGYLAGLAAHLLPRLRPQGRPRPHAA